MDPSSFKHGRDFPSISDHALPYLGAPPVLLIQPIQGAPRLHFFNYRGDAPHISQRPLVYLTYIVMETLLVVLISSLHMSSQNQRTFNAHLEM